jgi:hypothetical protein
MNKKILLLIICPLVIIIAGVLIWQYLWLPKEEAKNQTNLTQNNIQDETENWKTYLNVQYGIEFKYPSDWEVGQPPTLSENIAIGPKSMIEEMNEIEWETEGGYIPIKPDIKSDEAFKIVGERLITISNLSATEYDILVLQDLPGLQKDQKIIEIVVQNAADFYVIDLVKNQYLAIFEQMLSTFKFINH